MSVVVESFRFILWAPSLSVQSRASKKSTAAVLGVTSIAQNARHSFPQLEVTAMYYLFRQNQLKVKINLQC